MAQPVSVFVISSYVVSGQVGLKAMMPALRALNIEAVSLPTIILSAHPAAFTAHDPPVSSLQSPEQMLATADWLMAVGALDDCVGVITGYLPSPAHIEAAGEIVRRMRAKNDTLYYCCDPICGDDGALYLPQENVTALRDTLLPLADLTTPNLFELGVLSGDKALQEETLEEDADIIAAAKALSPPHVVVTSAPAPQGRIASLSVGAQTLRCETARAPRAPHGMGDCFAALYVGLHLQGEVKKLGITSATLAQMANHNLHTAQLPHGPVTLAQPAITDKLA